MIDMITAESPPAKAFQPIFLSSFYRIQDMRETTLLLRSDHRETLQSNPDRLEKPDFRINEKLEVRPLDLCGRLKSVPPLQVDEIKKPYIGLWVDWVTKLSSILKYSGDPELCILILSPIRDKGDSIISLTWIRCVVRVADFPPLKITLPDSYVRVVGVIEDLSPSSVSLTKVRLEFPSTPS